MQTLVRKQMSHRPTCRKRLDTSRLRVSASEPTSRTPQGCVRNVYSRFQPRRVWKMQLAWALIRSPYFFRLESKVFPVQCYVAAWIAGELGKNGYMHM